MHIVYRTTNKINGRYYIGMQNTNNESYLGSGLALVKAVKKYGGEKGKMYHWCANMKGGKKK